jgi:hypothetical protein
MSVVLMHVVNNNVYMFGDKRLSTTISNNDGKLIVKPVHDNQTKVFKNENNVLIGIVGSRTAYYNLLSETFKDDKIANKVINWSYSDFKTHYDNIYPYLYDWLNECEELKKYGEISKYFRVILCGLNDDGILCSTIYQYPSEFEKNIIQKMYKKDENTFIALYSNELKIRKLYKENPNFKFKHDFLEPSIISAFEYTLKQIAESDNTISTTYDMVKLSV